MHYQYLAAVILGALFLAVGLYYVAKIMLALQGRLKVFWGFMMGLISFFMIGYLLNIAFDLSEHHSHIKTTHPLTTTLIFLGGGLFVLFITRISFLTVESVKKIGRLTYEAERDPLTNLYNRRYFEKAIERLFNQTKRPPAVNSVLLFMDINKFKCINDNLGHSMGDNILKEIASIIVERTRKTDIAARFGGDEFVVLLYNTSPEGGKKIAVYIKEQMEKRCHHLFPAVRQSCPQAGCSIGLSVLDEEKKSIKQVIEEADKACYAAKHKGDGYHIVCFHEMSSK